MHDPTRQGEARTSLSWTGPALTDKPNRDSPETIIMLLSGPEIRTIDRRKFNPIQQVRTPYYKHKVIMIKAPSP